MAPVAVPRLAGIMRTVSIRYMVPIAVVALALANLLGAVDALPGVATVFTPRQLIDALMDVAVYEVQVATPLLALTEAVFQGVATPIRLNRSVSLVGTPDLPEPPMVLLFAKQKIQLQPGITFRFNSVVLQYATADSPLRAPNIYIFSASAAPSRGPNSTRVLVQNSVFIFSSCLPSPEMRKQSFAMLERPPLEVGSQSAEYETPNPPTCVNDSTAPLLERCWPLGRDIHHDVAMHSVDSTASGNTVPNNLTYRFLDTMFLCQRPATNECVATLGPYGCLAYTYQQLRGLPPAPISAQMTAIYAQQRQPGGPAASDAVTTNVVSEGSNDTAVLIGTIVGGIAGAVIVGLLVSILVRSLRQRLPQRLQLPQQQRASSGDLRFCGKARSASTCQADHGAKGCHAEAQSWQGVHQVDGSDYSNATAVITTFTALASCAPLELDVAAGGGRPTQPQVGGLTRMPLLLATPTQQRHSRTSSGCCRRITDDLVVRSAPLREDLATSFVVISRDTNGALGSAGEEASSECVCGGPVEPASLDRTNSSSRPGSSKHRCLAGAHKAFQKHSDATGNTAGVAIETATAIAEAINGSGGGGGSDSGGGGQAGQATTGRGLLQPARINAPQLATLLLERGSNMGSIWNTAQSSGLCVSTMATSTATPGGGDGGSQSGGGMDEASADDKVRSAAAAGGLKSVGAPAAAAVSLLPPRASCEAPAAAQVEVVELLPHKLGKGSFGRVVEGRYRGQRVAVKQALDLQDNVCTQMQQVVASFLQEVEVMGRCEHPNICKLLAACLAPPKLCLVMEMMDTNLEALIYGGPPRHLLPLPKLLHIAIQVAQGLEYLHPTVYHRDLKPANVLISDPESDTPVVKLTDFGLSKITEMTVQTANPEAGTPAYMAPECYDVTNHSLTHFMDMYSFGVLLWAMLTGLEPWKDFSVVAMAFSVNCGKRLPLDDISDSRCPRKLRGIIEQCWDSVPRRRPAAAEVAKELLLVREQLLSNNVLFA